MARSTLGLLAALAAALAIATPSALAVTNTSYAGASEDGTRVFFQTRDPLVAADTDSAMDVYQRSGGVTTLLSRGPTGGNGNNAVTFAGASSDGTRVFFTTSERLVSSDLDIAGDIYMREGSTTTLISTGPNGGNDAASATFAGVSDDGARVFMETSETLVPATDTDSRQDVYMREGTTTTLVSTGPNGGNGNTTAEFAGASANGAAAFFTTSEKLVTPADADIKIDIYRRLAGVTALFSKGPDGGNGAFDVTFHRVSDDAAHVFFSTAEQLETPEDGDSQTDLYDHTPVATNLVSTGPNGGNGGHAASFGDASADGTIAYFSTTEQLVTPADSDNSIDFYKRTAGTTTLVTTGPDGGNGVFNAGVGGATDDGSLFFFSTAEVLRSPDDSDSQADIYSRGVQTTLVSTGPSGGNGAFAAFFLGASADGSHVFFQTSEHLAAPPDLDNVADIYERSGGTTKLVSTGPAGGNGPFFPELGGFSADGTRVFFGTPEQLTTDDTDADTDVYERSGGTTTLVSMAGDTDHDGVLDPSDNCDLSSNPNQSNNDGDTQGDVCDTDDDNDGADDKSDNCVLVSNPTQANTDNANDGGDACDSDDDNDGVADTSDNCSVVANATQVNSDLKQGGDACDSDDDNDGLPDTAEAKRKTKPLDQDSDDDGISDGREVKVAKTNPAKFDTDGDGLSDGIERGVTKPIADPPGVIVATSTVRFRTDLDPKTRTKPLKKDSDGDKLADGKEDKNHNGRKDKKETSPLKQDTDGDGFNDRIDKKPLNKHKH